MRNFFSQLRSRGAPTGSRSRSRSRSPSPSVNNNESWNGQFGDRETIIAGEERASAALRSRNPRDPQYRHGGGRHGATSSSAPPSRNAAAPSYVIRPLPWMSPTSHRYSSSGAIEAGKSTGGGGGGGGRSYHNHGGGGATSYLWAGHYSQTALNGGGRHPRTYHHPRAGARSSLGMTMRRCRRRLPPGAVALLGGFAACALILLLYVAVSWIVRSVLYARDGDNYYDGSYGGHRFYHQPEPLDGLKFQEWTVRGTSASVDLDRDLELAHRLELLRRPKRPRFGAAVKDAAAASGKAEEEEDSFRSYMDHRRHVLERIVPKWLHRNDAAEPNIDKEKSGGGSDGNNQQVNVAEAAGAGIPSEARKLERGSLMGKEERPMITLSNMDQHRGHSCPADNSDDVRTTLVLQASPDRMWIMNETCRRWRDPIVVVVGMVNATAAAPAEEALSAQPSWNRTLHDLRLACPHLTLLEQEITHDPVLYPVNRLRNLALDAVTTSHVLVMDADFVPSTNLNEKIRNVLQSQQQQRSSITTGHDGNGDYAALVVPAFERVDRPPCSTPEDCMSHLLHNSSYIPQTFEELQSCVSDQNCQVFQLENNWPGHYSTRSGEWLQRQWYEERDATNNSTTTALQRRRIRQVPCFHSLRYEPYVVISWCGGTSAAGKDNKPRAPYYDERFYGYGKNKIEYLQHLRLLGYQFEILPEGFLVHNPHVDSRAKLDWNAHRSSLHHDMDQLYPRFLQELLEHPSMDHSRPIVGLCSDDKDKKKKSQQEA